MKNSIIPFLETKGKCASPEDKLKFLLDLYKVADTIGIQRKEKWKLINQIHETSVSRHNRGVVYVVRKFFGFEYKSRINHEPLYQAALLHLTNYSVQFAKDNNLLDEDYVRVLKYQRAIILHCLQDEKMKEEKEILLNW